MKIILMTTFITLMLGQAFAEESSHEDHSKSSLSTMVLNNGAKWEIDQTMKKNMSAIIDGNKEIAALVNSNKATKGDYNNLSNLISNSAQDIVKNCKMEQKEDEVFHNVLADLMIVSEHLKNSKAPKQAVLKLNETLNTYLKYFNHPVSKQ